MTTSDGTTTDTSGTTPPGSSAETAAPAASSTPVPGDTSVLYSEAWKARVGGFATAVGKNLDEVTRCLEGVVGVPGDEALDILSNVSASPDADLRTAFAGLSIPSGKFNMHLPKLRGTPAVSAASASASSSGAMQVLSILPPVPDGPSFVESLKVGGNLKVGKIEVISAVKAALAKRVNLFDLPELILAEMEKFAESQEEPCGDAFFKMQKLLTERRYGEVLSALGVPGSFVSDKRKNQFFGRIDAVLWTALSGFHNQLLAWQQAWMNGAGNPGMIMMAMASQASGSMMPPGVMAPPDTMPIRSSAEEVVNAINRVFAGPGIPVARALAYDATRIMTILEDPTLPSQIGVGTKEQMLKELGVNVGADIVRTEQGLTRYTLAIMSLPEVTADAELAYLAAMLQLGSTIPWDKLAEGVTSSSRPGIGGALRKQL